MESTAHARATRRCQWCMEPIPDGASACPACHAAVPDPAATLPEAEAAASGPSLSLGDDGDLLPGLLDAGSAVGGAREVAQDPLQNLVATAALLLMTGLGGVLAGIVVAPPLLSHFAETTLQMSDVDPADFRRLGAFLGLLLGMLLGSGIGTLVRR